MKKSLPTLLIIALFLPYLRSQDLYDLNTLRSIYINFENPNYHDIMVNNWHEENGERELATLEMDGILYDSVAIRYKGNATFFWAEETDNPKMPLNIDMNDFIADQDLLGFNKVKLANSFFDPTVLRDVLGAKFYGDYMPSAEANWMKVYIEDEYIGVYPNTESINKQFLKKHFDYKKGVLFKCDPSAQFGTNTLWESPDLAWYGTDSTLYYNRYELKTDHGWAEMLHLIDVLNNNPSELPSILNIDRVLWYLAVSTTLSNYDAYNGFYIHNYYLYLHENGLFQIIPWDLSETFVGILLDGDVVNGNAVYEFDIFNQNDPFMENRPLVDFVYNHPLYRKQYLAHIRTVMNEVLNENELLNTMQNMQSIIADAHAEDNNAFFTLGNIYFESNLTTDVNSFGLNVAGILSAAQKRKTYLENHPEVSLIAPEISDVNRSSEFPNAGETVTVTAFVDNTMQVDLMVTSNKYASHFEAVQMLDDGMHGDGSADDGIYGATIPFSNAGDEVKYYIRAQNDDAMMLDPQRAEYEFHEYTVSQMTNLASVESSESQLIVSPNPSDGRINIQVKNGEWDVQMPVEVYSVTGQLLNTATITFSNNEGKMDLSELNKGVYFLKIGEFQAVKIVI